MTLHQQPPAKLHPPPLPFDLGLINHAPTKNYGFLPPFLPLLGIITFLLLYFEPCQILDLYRLQFTSSPLIPYIEATC